MRSWILGLLPQPHSAARRWRRTPSPRSSSTWAASSTNPSTKPPSTGAEKFKKETGVELPRLRDHRTTPSASRRCAASPRDGYSPDRRRRLRQATALKKVAEDSRTPSSPSSTWWSSSRTCNRSCSRSMRARSSSACWRRMASKTGKVGFVGGMDIPLIRKFACGYAQGVKYGEPGRRGVPEHDRHHRRGLERPGQGRRARQGQIDRGADVIYDAAGGTGIGVLQAAADAGKLGIGVDSQPELPAPRQGADLDAEARRRRHLQRLQATRKNGTWKPGVSVLGLDEDGVGYALDDNNKALITAGDEGRGRQGRRRHHRRARSRCTTTCRTKCPVLSRSIAADAERWPDVGRHRRPARGSAGNVRPTPLAIELIGIDKRFGPVQANKDIDLAVARGTIHGIVGENGAGKSTLMSILYGFYQADAGEIRVDGKPIAHPRASATRSRAGIGMVHQHFMLVEQLHRAGERHARRRGRRRCCGRRARKARAELERLARDYGLEVDPDAIVDELSGRPAAAGRDPEGALSRRRHPDPRRADRRADAGRGRPPVPHPASAEGAGQDHHPHHPQAARDHGGDRQRLRHAARRDGGDARHRRDLAGRARRADGRPPRAAARREGRRASPARRCSRSRTSRVRDDTRRRRGSKACQLRRPRGRDRRHRRRRRQRPVRAARGARRHAASRRAATIRLDGRDARRRSERDPHALRRRGLLHVPEDRQRMGLVLPFAACENAILGYHDEPRYGAGALLDRNAVDRATLPAKMEHFDVRPRDAAPEDRQVLRRQPAEDRARARDRARPRRCCSSASRRAASTSARSSSSTTGSSRCATRARRSCWSRSSSTRSCRWPTASLVMFDGRIIGERDARRRPTSASSAC